MVENRSPRRTVGTVLWWVAALVVAPVAALVAVVSAIGVDARCHPAPATLGCLDWDAVVVAVVVPAAVLGSLWAGARLLAGDGTGAGVRMVRAHLALVAVLTAAFVAALVVTTVTDQGSVGSSLLLGVGGMPLMVLGFPWTFLREYVLPDHGSRWVEAAVELVAVVGPAALNVALHEWVRRLVARRRGQRARQYPVA